MINLSGIHIFIQQLSDHLKGGNVLELNAEEEQQSRTTPVAETVFLWEAV